MANKLHVSQADLKSSTAAIQDSIMSGSWPQDLLKELEERLTCVPFSGNFLAIRSSGTDEDSAAHSFAGSSEFVLVSTDAFVSGYYSSTHSYQK